MSTLYGFCAKGETPTCWDEEPMSAFIKQGGVWVSRDGKRPRNAAEALEYWTRVCLIYYLSKAPLKVWPADEQVDDAMTSPIACCDARLVRRVDVGIGVSHCDPYLLDLFNQVIEEGCR